MATPHCLTPRCRHPQNIAALANAKSEAKVTTAHETTQNRDGTKISATFKPTDNSKYLSTKYKVQTSLSFYTCGQYRKFVGSIVSSRN